MKLREVNVNRIATALLTADDLAVLKSATGMPFILPRIHDVHLRCRHGLR